MTRQQTDPNSGDYALMVTPEELEDPYLEILKYLRQHGAELGVLRWKLNQLDSQSSSQAELQHELLQAIHWLAEMRRSDSERDSERFEKLSRLSRPDLSPLERVLRAVVESTNELTMLSGERIEALIQSNSSYQERVETWVRQLASTSSSASLVRVQNERDAIATQLEHERSETKRLREYRSENAKLERKLESARSENKRLSSSEQDLRRSLARSLPRDVVATCCLLSSGVTAISIVGLASWAAHLIG
jgi:hypothetical protein